MPAEKKSITIAIMNSNQDIVETIQLFLNEEGFHSVGAHVTDFKKGTEDFVAFCQAHNPQVIIFDIAPPYQENWTFCQLLQNTKEAEGRPFILTTTNKRALERVVGKTEALEIFEKPYDLEALVTAVNKVLKR